jgi:hypothetical protein
VGAIAIAAAVVGAGLIAGGTASSAKGAKKRRNELQAAQDRWLPNIDKYTEDYFGDLQSYLPEADALADAVGTSDTERALAMQEQAMPGMAAGRKGAFDALMPLLRGELPPSVMEAFMRSGGASTANTGFGGSGFGFLNTGLFGAKGALGAMQTGYGLLPALMSTLPQVNSPSTASFLNAIMSPAQRTQTQMQIRGQNMQNAMALAGMQTQGEVVGSSMQQTGGILLGGAVGMGGGGGGGMGGMMGGGAPSGGGAGGGTISSPNYVTPL